MNPYRNQPELESTPREWIAVGHGTRRSDVVSDFRLVDALPVRGGHLVRVLEHRRVIPGFSVAPITYMVFMPGATLEELREAFFIDSPPPPKP